MELKTAISLFSGMGGDSLGLKQAGLKLTAYSEYIDAFRKTHDLNFPDSILLGKDCKSDVSKIKDDEFIKFKNKIDVIFAGFPCQSYSSAGKRKVNDPRDTLFKDFARATKLINPKVFIGENVKGLLTKKRTDGKKYIDIIVEEFEKLNYNVICQVFKCYKFGIPQKRERLIILGIRNDLGIEPSFPKETNVIKGLEDIIEFNMTGSIKITKDDFDMTTIPSECIVKDLGNDEDEDNPHPYLKLKAKTRDKEYKGKTHHTLLSFSKRASPIHCEIIDIRKPSKTIICTYDHQPRLFVPLQNKNGYYLRCLLPKELKQIQGFPKNYKMNGNLKQQITQIGNAVPPPLIKMIVNHIKNLKKI